MAKEKNTKKVSGKKLLEAMIDQMVDLWLRAINSERLINPVGEECEFQPLLTKADLEVYPKLDAFDSSEQFIVVMIGVQYEDPTGDEEVLELTALYEYGGGGMKDDDTMGGWGLRWLTESEPSRMIFGVDKSLNTVFFPGA